MGSLSAGRLAAVLVAVLLVVWSLRTEAAQGASVAHEKVAMVLEEGAVARGAMVALGRDIVVAGEARDDVAAISGSVRVSGTVRGNVLALGGDVALGAGAQVEGEVFVFGGTLEAAPGSYVQGRTVTYSDVPGSWLALIEGPVMGLHPASPTVLAAKAALLCGWAVVMLLIFAVAPREAVVTSAAVFTRPFANAFVALGTILALVLVSLLLASFAGPMVGVPMVLVLVLVAVLLKLWGQVAVFHAVGAGLSRLAARGRPAFAPPQPVAAASLGLLILGLLRFVPYLGSWVWMAATVIGIGAALFTKLGREGAEF